MTVTLAVTVHEALDYSGWKAAMDNELASIHKIDTWDLVPFPSHRNAITTKWVYCIKTHADGSTNKFKAHLVANGFQQKEG